MTEPRIPITSASTSTDGICRRVAPGVRASELARPLSDRDDSVLAITKLPTKAR